MSTYIWGVWHDYCRKIHCTFKDGYTLITGMNHTRSSQHSPFPVNMVSNHGSAHRGSAALTLQQMSISFCVLSRSLP